MPVTFKFGYILFVERMGAGKGGRVMPGCRKLFLECLDEVDQGDLQEGVIIEPAQPVHCLEANEVEQEERNVGDIHFRFAVEVIEPRSEAKSLHSHDKFVERRG